MIFCSTSVANHLDCQWISLQLPFKTVATTIAMELFFNPVLSVTALHFQFVTLQPMNMFLAVSPIVHGYRLRGGEVEDLRNHAETEKGNNKYYIYLCKTGND